MIINISPLATRLGKNLVKRILVIQGAALLILSSSIMIFFGIEWGKASFIGGGIFFLANMIFSLCAFLFSGANHKVFVLISFYAGELIKLVVTAILFSIVFIYMKVELIPLVSSYLFLLTINFFTPVLFIK
ncbi:ATP synthase protein I [Candidatus Photodesmus katoptron]|uniref:ATP synthase protein I n=1 Tax=Candidatus Photodesmus katoptron Akat1 TaxID=1236703 RepID=S3DIK1_9GAMM|nr:F0F1 ATP synthase subunit I [Candidatus Photodesmus katoptron]EPE37550.1 ATP synthase protein I [Candidatus Photodesmus katoptron Akat1]KEY90201.1 ATP synthase protein I [Candidatus Photodesmus katoptron]